MYCAAREAKVRVCTVYVIAPPEQCRTWNTSREDGRSYVPDTLENLIQRYEDPSGGTRHSLPSPPTITGAPSPRDSSNRPTQAHKRYVPSPSYTRPLMTDESMIYDLLIYDPYRYRCPLLPSWDVSDICFEWAITTTALVSAIAAAQSASSIPGGTLSLGVPMSTSTSAPSTPPFKLTLTLPPRHLTLSELGRLKRQFITMHKRAITLGSTEMGKVDWSEESVAHKFVEYLEENVSLSG
ncbi:hypothetical protein JVT61DRAFT_4379 [Boletus reticuloceps]|uniref:Uncharacterized protein n=1 Tax=Boletus reticuloceps TaxID=495285 RepID=A0A8I2YLH5_9AGAM|nr:hypothetical protein JVT61DRAFT_4379 [Boletus reticuloceps]